MRPVFLNRAASRGRRAARCALLAVALPMAALAIAGLAHAEGAPGSHRPSFAGTPARLDISAPPQADNAVPARELQELFARWQLADRSNYGRALLPDVATMVARARSSGLASPDMVPMLMVVEADVRHAVGSGSDCAAGAESYARLLQTAPDAFLLDNKKVKMTVDRLNAAYAHCPQALQTITTMAAAPSQALTQALVDGIAQGVEEAQRKTTAEAAHDTLTPLPRGNKPNAFEETVGGAMHKVETTLTDSLVSLTGEPAQRALADLPWLDPRNERFKRFLWWSVLLAIFVLVKSGLSQTKDLLRGGPELGESRGVVASRMAPTSGSIEKPRRRQSVIVRK